MTVSAQTPINRSTANGVTTVFPYNFKVLAAADLEVSLDGVVKTLTTDYTLSGVGDDAGGNVTMLSAPANGVTVVRRRNMAYTREVDYQDQGELPTDTLDDDQDAPILMIQQVAEGLSRAVSLPPESSGVSPELPTPGALQYLRWNAAADALESVLLADVSLISLTAYAQTLLNAVDAAAARLVLGITTFGSSLVTAANSAAARIAMGAAASGANNDITSLTALTSINILSGYLFGCTLSTAGSSATMSIAAGKAQDSTGVQLMTLTAIAKTTSAWAVGTGNGGLDTGSIANSTWYHFYVIRRPDTGVVDVVFSTSASAPTLPTNYTQYRRIGSGKTNGSAQWTSFVQDGDYFRWLTGVLDVNATNPGTASVSATLSAPTGVNVEAFGQVVLKQTTTVTLLYMRDLAATDEAVSITAAPLASIGTDTVNGALIAGTFSLRTNTSAQIGYRLNISDGSVIVRIVTAGWKDSRGRSA